MHSLSLALAAAAILAGPAPAGGQETTVAWSTYLRAGPGAAYAALDELEHDAAVTRLGCTAGWCRVRRGGREGFVDQSALDLPVPRPVGGVDCVRTRLADDTARPFTRLCGPASAAASASGR